jgi:HlyD family secretion protein
VFEVSVEINGTDATLRPSMTTSNKILANAVDSALYIPLESLHSQFDSITYVFKEDGLNILKQEVIVGETNANDAIVLSGLQENERVYLSMPQDMEDQEIILLPEMNGKRKKKEEKEEKKEPIPLVVSKVSNK